MDSYRFFRERINIHDAPAIAEWSHRFGCTPGLLPEFLTGALRGANLEQLAERISSRLETVR